VTTANLSDLSLLVPELILVGTTLVLLLAAPRIRGTRAAAAGTVAAALAAAVASCWVASGASRTGFGGMIALDGYSRFFKVLIAATLAVATLLSVKNGDEEQVPRAEYHALLLLASTGMMLSVSSIDLLTLYLGLELMTLSSYILVGITVERPASNEAAIKYFLLGSFASGLLLYGTSLTYGLTGATDFASIAASLSGIGTGSRPLVLAAVGLPADMDYMAFVDAHYAGVPVRVSRSGYTGERGYELLPPWGHAPRLWEALLQAAGPLGGRACGLGARDTLRTEMGYPLHGQDLGPEITPVQGGASWAVGWDKPAFWGRAALLAERKQGPSRRLRGLRATGRGVPRPHMAVCSSQGAPLGKTTSGTFSPTLRTGIALALLAPGVRPGDIVEVDVRGRALPCEVVKTPFLTSRVR